MNRQVVGLGNQLGLLALATCIAWTGCSPKVTYVGIDIQMLVAINVDRSRIATLEFYLDELDGSPAIFDVVTTAWQDGVQNGVPYKMRHDDIDSDQKYELVFRIDQNLFNATNSFSFSISGERRSLLFKIKARVRDANDAILGTGESSALNFDGTLQSARVNICANAQCPTGVSVGSDGGADILHSVQLTLDPGVVAANVASLDFYFDEAPGNGTLYAAAVTTPSYGLLDDYLYSYTIEDVDADSKYELQVNIAANVFATTSVFSFGLSGTAATAPFQIVARVRNASGSVLGSGTSATITLGTSVQPATVTICATPSGCSGGTGDAGIGDAGAGPDAGAGAGAGGGADAGASADAGGGTDDGGGAVDAGSAADGGAGADAGASGPAWCWQQTATAISTETRDAGYPQVVVDSSGNAHVVWYQKQFSFPYGDVYASRYTASNTTWSAGTSIESGDSNMLPPQIAGDTAGNAISLWGDTANGLWSSSYAGSWSWPLSPFVPDAGGAVSGFAMAHDLVGGKTASVWLVREGSYDVVSASLYASSAWQLPVRVQSALTISASDPKIAVGSGGATTIAVWQQGTADVWAAVNTGSWAAAQQVDTEPGAVASPAIAVDSNGVGHLAWSQAQDDGGTARLRYAKYPSAAWTTPVVVDPATVLPDTDPQMGVDGTGVVTLIWRRGLGNGTTWTSRNETGAWTSPVRISGDFSSDVVQPRLAVQANGNAVAVWSQGDGVRLNLWANRATATGLWGDAGVLDALSTDVVGHQVAIGADGTAVAVWSQTTAIGPTIHASVCR